MNHKNIKKNNNSVFIKFIHFITFINQPISKRFRLFFLGVLWWFLVMTGVSIILLNQNYSFTKFINREFLPTMESSQILLEDLDEIILETHNVEISTDWTKQFESVNKLELKNTFIINRLQESDIDKSALKKINELLSIQSKKIAELKKTLLKGINKNGTLQLLNNIIENYNSSREILIKTFDNNNFQLKDRIKDFNFFLNTIVLISIIVLVIAVFLLLVFTMYIKKAISKPIVSIISQVDKLVEGVADLNEKIDVNSMDEIGELSNKLNKLTEKIYEINVFKKIIEEDYCLDDVFSRLSDIFINMGLDNFIIYELDKDNNRKVVFPENKTDRHKDCQLSLYSNSLFCRALKANRIMSSIEFPKVCEKVLCGEEEEHVCIPLILPNSPHMVVQFIIEKNSAKISDKLKRAQSFLNESRNVIETKRLMDKLRENSIKDHLTGLYNRRFLKEILNSIIAGVKRRGESICLIMGDIDYFKKINDNYGHDVGDKVLKMVADTLTKNVRESDLVLRYGGEEFLLILRDIKEAEVKSFTEKLRYEIEKRNIFISNHEISCTISFGVSFYPGDSGEFQEALKFSDEALYTAKKQGRNRVVRYLKNTKLVK